MEIRIPRLFDGKTVKDYLYRNGVSRAMIIRLKKREDGILLNGQHVTVRGILRENDLLSLAIDDRPEDENPDLHPVEMPLDILFENDDLIAVNKPAGVPTHPAIGHFEDTLANGLSYYFSSRGIPFCFRAINRLDRNTSGVVLVAKNQISAAKLTALLQAGKIKKRYLAILNGHPEPSDGEIDRPIRRQKESIILRETCKPDAPGAKPALTRYQTAASSERLSAVIAEPVTGRTHQLRVHFASIGCPLVGDGLYGSAETEPSEADRQLSRHALHALSLTVEDEHPLSFSAPLPDDLRKLCRENHLSVENITEKQKAGF